MSPSRRHPIVLLTGFLSVTLFAAAGARPGTYLGEDPPGLVPKLLAPGIISRPDRHESFITFMPDGSECYFTVHQKDWAPYVIMMTAFRNGTWTPIERAPFSNERSLCPSISPDGSRLVFGSDRGTAGGAGVWQCLRTEAGGWSEPVEMPEEVSSRSMEFSCHLSDRGNLFVCSWRPGGAGGCDGWCIAGADVDHAEPAKNLQTLNSAVGDCGFVPGPKEAYLIFQSRRPPTGNGGGFFGTDLFITFSDGAGGWTEPRNLGPVINSPATDGFASLSHDGRYLFFASDRAGTNDIYWVSVDAFLPTPDGPVALHSSGQRFASIQAAINFAEPDDEIVLSPGTYRENLVLPDYALTIRSQEPANKAFVASTIVVGDGLSPFIELLPGQSLRTIQGLTIAADVRLPAANSRLQIKACAIGDTRP